MRILNRIKRLLGIKTESDKLWDEIEEVCKNDCEIMGEYIDKQGMTCAVGGLALAAGVDKEVLVKAGDQNVISSAANDIFAAIKHRFGLNRNDLLQIQRANDYGLCPQKVIIVSTPRDRVLAWIKQNRIRELV